MTDGGIIGQIVHVAEDRLTIRTAENTRIVVARTKIARVMTAETGETKANSGS
jgi:preprotein translocase subunit YajC